MFYHLPKVVELTSKESKLYEIIPNSMSNNTKWPVIADAMESLFKSLVKRQAIPELRLRIFFDDEYAEVRNKSPRRIFESNGTCGNDIFRHPHFIKHLRYFINGPNLPQKAISGFCKILNNDEDTSRENIDRLRRFVRNCVRQYGLDRKQAASNFFKLAVELDLDLNPSIFRKAALSVR